MTTYAPHTSASIREFTDLHGRTAIVTGGAVGIGRGIAERLHEAGARIVVADLDGTHAERTAEALHLRRDLTALALTVDVSDEDAVDAMVERAVEQFGAVDILVNNAGGLPLRRAGRHRRRNLPASPRHVNLVGLFLCTKAVPCRAA